MEMSDRYAATYAPAGSELMQRACPSPEDVPFFNHFMSLAKEMGMSWREALEYVIAQREGCAGPALPMPMSGAR
jgi:hypothetical protein